MNEATEVAGTRGYASRFEAFVEASGSLDFETTNAPFLPFLPDAPARILDAGAGIGQNAAVLARRGHRVVAVEPLAAFLDHARAVHARDDVEWIQDGLPDLARLGAPARRFDFVLVQAVWHHLDPAERRRGIGRLAGLLSAEGHLAISLRNGPAGAGTHVFPTDADETANTAGAHGLEVVLDLRDRPSLLPGKPAVTWAHMVFRRSAAPGAR